MRILITGSNGFIANSISEYLSEDNLLFGMVRCGGVNKNTYILDNFVYNGEMDPIKLNEFIKENEIDSIVHIGATYKTDPSHEVATELLFDNVLLSTYLMSIAKENNITYIGAESWSAYNEIHEYKPDTFYDSTKYVSHLIGESLNLDNEAKFFYLTFSDTFGKCDPRPKLHNLINQGKLDTVNSKSWQVMNMTSVIDIARMIEYILVNIDDFEYGIHEYDLLYNENRITLGELADLFDKEMTFLGEKPIKEVPLMLNELKGFEIKYPVRDCLLQSYKESE